MIESIAAHLQIDACLGARLNCYGKRTNNFTPYGQEVTKNTLPAIFDRLIESSDYAARRNDILQFNAASQTHLRDIALTPVKFGISFTRKAMNQAMRSCTFTQMARCRSRPAERRWGRG